MNFGFYNGFFFHQGLLACEKYYREALRLRPHYVAAWENLGLVLLNTGKVVKPKPMLSQWPIRNKWISRRARRAGKRARPSRYWYEFVIDWLRWWYKFSGPITERKKRKIRAMIDCFRHSIKIFFIKVPSRRVKSWTSSWTFNLCFLSSLISWHR